MHEELIKANLNLTALLQNMEELAACDIETASLIENWQISIQFTCLRGPRSHLVFSEGQCRFGSGKIKSPGIHLLFLSPKHCNNVFDSKATPIPIKGLAKLKILIKEFPLLTDRLEFYLRPTNELLQDEKYLELNTLLTLNTAAYGVVELARLDPIARLNARRIQNGAVLMKVAHGPSVHIVFEDGGIQVKKGDVDNPMAEMSFKDVRIANDFLNGKADTFAAIASGDVMLRGQLPMLENIGLILDRLAVYLS